MRHRREEVMYDVPMGYTMQEETTLPSQEVPINRRTRATLEGPRIASVMRYLGIGVVQVCDHNEPVRDQEPGNAV